MWAVKTEEFFQVERFVESFETIGPEMEIASFQFVADFQYDVYEKVVFSLADMFSNAGGLFNSLFTLGFAFTATFSYRLFISSLIRQLFHFPPEKSATKKSEKDGEDDGVWENEARPPSIFVNHTDVSEYSIGKSLHYDSIRQEMLQVLGSTGAGFNYRTRSILKTLFCCMLCRKRKWLRESRSNRKVLYYYKGQEQLDKELDIVSILRSIRKLQTLLRLLLERDQ